MHACKRNRVARPSLSVCPSAIARRVRLPLSALLPLLARNHSPTLFLVVLSKRGTARTAPVPLFLKPLLHFLDIASFIKKKSDCQLSPEKRESGSTIYWLSDGRSASPIVGCLLPLEDLHDVKDLRRVPVEPSDQPPNDWLCPSSSSPPINRSAPKIKITEKYHGLTFCTPSTAQMLGLFPAESRC
jgi:hypothetical protein